VPVDAAGRPAIEDYKHGTSEIAQTTLGSILGRVDLDEMRRAMAAQAEAERERRAKVIHALGEKEAASTLGEAAVVLEAHPAAMQLRVLSTMAEVSAERNSTLIFLLPIELLRLVDAIAGNGQPGNGSGPGRVPDRAGHPPAAGGPTSEGPA
jgi:regulator of protease activity HflC (stomatin/prohibitin superfamily)